jgi:hypothetical protein
MEKKNLWWIIILVIGILITAGYLLSQIEIKTLDCSIFHPDNCNKYCISDGSCRYACGCGCIQSNESCSLKRKLLFGDQMSSLVCEGLNCSCKNNICSVDVSEATD